MKTQNALTVIALILGIALLVFILFMTLFFSRQEKAPKGHYNFQVTDAKSGVILAYKEGAMDPWIVLNGPRKKEVEYYLRLCGDTSPQTITGFFYSPTITDTTSTLERKVDEVDFLFEAHRFNAGK